MLYVFRAALIVGLDGNQVGWKSFTYLVYTHVAIVKPCRRGVGLVDWMGPLAGVGLMGQGPWCKYSACVVTSHTSTYVHVSDRCWGEHAVGLYLVTRSSMLHTFRISTDATAVTTTSSTITPARPAITITAKSICFARGSWLGDSKSRAIAYS